MVPRIDPELRSKFHRLSDSKTRRPYAALDAGAGNGVRASAEQHVGQRPR